MSERSSLISEYIYDTEDYKKCKEALEPVVYLFDTNILGEVPIISAYVHVTSSPNTDWIEIYDCLSKVKTKGDVRFSLLMDGGTNLVFVKRADGTIQEVDSDVFEDDEENFSII